MLCNLNIYRLRQRGTCSSVSSKTPASLLGVLTLGIGGGAMLAGLCSRGKVELGLVPFGSVGIAVTSMLLAAVPGGSAGHPAVSGYYWSGFWLLMLGLTAGLYDIPLQAFLQDRSPPEARGSIMAAYNFLAFAGMLVASGMYWVLSGPLGLSPRTIFFIGGVITLPATFFIIRLLPYQTTRMAARLVVRCLYRLRVEGQENVPPSGGVLLAANHVSWADAILIGLACPRHPRMVAYAKYFESPWLSWFGRLTRIIPIGTTRKSMAESIRAAARRWRRARWCAFFPRAGSREAARSRNFAPAFCRSSKRPTFRWCPSAWEGSGEAFSASRGESSSGNGPAAGPIPSRSASAGPIHQPESPEQVQRAVEELQIEK